jgi:DNA-binding NarL/FixJ family response regulator
MKQNQLSPPLNIGIIEDQPDFKGIVVEYFLKNNHHKLVACCKSVKEALQFNSLTTIDILLLDIGLPGKSGVTALPELLESNPRMKVIMLTVFEDKTNLFNSLRFGANGYLLKSDWFMHLEEAIKQVQLGGMLFSPSMAQKVLQHFRCRPFQKIQLTKMERCVLLLMRDGLTKKEMAEKLILSYHTIDSHIRNIYKKLQVNSNIKALHKAEQEHLI